MELLDCGVFHTGRKTDLESLFWVKTLNLKHRLIWGIYLPGMNSITSPAFPKKLHRKSSMRNSFLHPSHLGNFTKAVRIIEKPAQTAFPRLAHAHSQFDLTSGSSFPEVIINVSGLNFSLPTLGPDFQRTKNFLKISS